MLLSIVRAPFSKIYVHEAQKLGDVTVPLQMYNVNHESEMPTLPISDEGSLFFKTFLSGFFFLNYCYSFICFHIFIPISDKFCALEVAYISLYVHNYNRGLFSSLVFTL